MEYPKCPIGRDEGIKRDNPINREAATAIQLHDTTVNLWQFPHAHDDNKAFKQALVVLKAQIAAYEDRDD